MEHPSRKSKRTRHLKIAPAITCAKREHDINGMLGAITLHVDLFKRRTDVTDDAKSGLDGILTCVERIKAITSGCKAHAATELAEPRPIDVGVAVELALRIVRMRTPENIRLIINRPMDPVFVTVNESALSRMLVNLLMNALQAIVPNAGAITASCVTVRGVAEIPETTRTAYELTDQPHVLVRVTDTGHGMDEEQIMLAHHAFFTTKEHGQGLGLGVVRDFVDSVNGGLHIESTVGIGTTFSIYVPTKSDVKTAKESGSGIRILSRDPPDG